MTAFELRKARLADVAALQQLIQRFVVQGIMLPRTELELAEHIRDFVVAVDSAGSLVGAGALHIYTPTMAEVRSLAVDPETQGSGVGRQIVEALVREAENLGLQALFAFTYVTGFFERLGFHEVSRNELPLKVWKDCLRCPKLQACDEVAVLRHLGVPKDSPLFLPIHTIDEMIIVPHIKSKT